MTPEVHRLVRMADAEEPVADPLHRLVALPLCGDGKREWHRQIGEPAVGHQQMPQTKTMNRADKKVRRLSQAQPFQPASQFACALLAIGDACCTARRAHVFSHDPGELEHQRLGLAAARASKHDAMSRRVIGRLLARIAGQVGRLG